MLANISSLVNVEWYLGELAALSLFRLIMYLLGIPLNDTTNLRLAIAEVAEPVLGKSLLGFQVGNEPDQYAQYASFSPVFRYT